MGCMHLLRVSGWVAVLVAAPAVQIVRVAARLASAPSLQPAGADGVTPEAEPRSVSAPAGADGQGLSTAAVDPAYFSPGACVAFPPTTGNRHLTVFLDAGRIGP